ncbi:MAG: TonB-dependent receptor [Proteobacteria bacterium]|nr:TonB-dependent receptor [Pseudomonadota bacterium]
MNYLSKKVAVCAWAAASFMLLAGTATAHMTAFDPGVPPDGVQSGTVTLPGGETAAVLTQSECEARKQGDESCDGGALFVQSGAALASNAQVSYVIMVNGQSQTGSGTIGSDGIVLGRIISGGGFRLPQVTVTARKREESSQSVPIALTAVGQFQLEKGSFRDIRDLNGLSANVRIESDPSRTSAANINIRGISPTRTDDNSFDSPIGVMIDGIHLGSLSGQILENFDLERIEVLRGPQGTLFGKNTVGGVVHVIRTRPTGEWGAKVQLTGGSWGQLEARAVFNVPVVEDKLALKAFFTHIESDGFVRNTFRDERAPKRDYQNFGMTALWTPNDWFEAILTVEKFQDESEGGAFLTNGNTSAFLSCLFGSVPCREDPDTFQKTSQTDLNNPSHLDVDAITLNMKAQINENLTVVSVTGFRDMTENRKQDFDGSSADYITLQRDNEYQQFSQEVRLEGSWDTSMGNISFVAGAHYWRSKFTQNWITGGDFWDFVANLSGYSLKDNVWLNPDFEAFANANLGAGIGPAGACISPNPMRDLIFGQVQCDSGAGDRPYGAKHPNRLFETQTTKSIALFAQADWEFVPDWTLTAGVRWTEEKKDFTGAQAYIFPLDRIDEINFPFFGNFNNTWRDTSLKLGLSWQATDDILAYFTYAEGFHSGGYFGVNQNVSDFERDQYDPEFAKTYELGIKSEFFDNRLQANFALFYNDFKDKQEQSVQFDPTTNTVATVFSNVADAVYKGAELEVTALVTENFTMFGSVGYLKASYKNFFTDVDPNDTCSGLPECVVNADFLIPRNAPEWVFGIGGSYVFRLGNNGEIEFYAKYDWVGKVEGNLVNLPTGRVGSRENLQASISYSYDNYKFTVFGRNLTNDRIESFTLIAPLFASGTINAGASWGVELTADF